MRKKSAVVAALFALWVGVSGTGFYLLYLYSHTEGAPGEERAKWPSSALEKTPGKADLLVFVHPRCGCSRATLGELARLLRHLEERIRVRVLFQRPAGKTAEWARESALWRESAALPGVETLLDESGTMLSEFDARTSGLAALYDGDGNLVYRGGITPRRGHMGDSAGRASILAFSRAGRVELAAAPVFGCSFNQRED